jgi:Ulp1 family protease
LQPTKWVKDDVINFYVELIRTRHADMLKAALSAVGMPDDFSLSAEDLDADSQLRPLHVFSSFFWTTLIRRTCDNSGRVVAEEGYCYERVARWTKNINVFECKALLIPINFGNTHWALAVILPQEPRIFLLDSLRKGVGHTRVSEALLSWLEDELAAKKVPRKFSRSAWRLHRDGELLEFPVPQQDNGCDCGVFMLMFAHLAAVLKLPVFGQEDINLLRRKIVLACLDVKLPTPPPS